MVLGSGREDFREFLRSSPALLWRGRGWWTSNVMRTVSSSVGGVGILHELALLLIIIGIAMTSTIMIVKTMMVMVNVSVVTATATAMMMMMMMMMMVVVVVLVAVMIMIVMILMMWRWWCGVMTRWCVDDKRRWGCDHDDDIFRRNRPNRITSTSTSTTALSFSLRLCLRRPGSHVAYACACAYACAESYLP